MSAQAEVQAAVVAALAAADGIVGIATGVFDGPPADQPFPYLSIEGGVTLDWSTKTASGREHRLGIVVWDESGQAARLRGLLDATAAALEALPNDLPGHRIASLVFLREKIARDAAGPWAGLLEYRVRTLAS